MATGTFGARVATLSAPLPHLLFFSCLTLYVCGFLKVVGVGSGLPCSWGGSTQPRLREKLGIGLAWVSPLQVGARGARGQPLLFRPPPPPPQRPMKWGGAIPHSREKCPYQQKGAGMLGRW